MQKLKLFGCFAVLKCHIFVGTRKKTKQCFRVARLFDAVAAKRGRFKTVPGSTLLCLSIFFGLTQRVLCILIIIGGVILNRHSFTYEQYCTVVGKNIILEETTYHDGNKSIKCLHCHDCDKVGGCKNKYVISRIKRCENADSAKKSG